MMEEISLKVGELTNREEFGRGIVRIDTRKMQDLGIKEGEIVELQGQKKTGAIAVRSYPADVGLNLIRMDGITRRNAGIGVGENIKVVKANVKEAKRIVLAPAQKGIILQMSPDLLKKNLIMRPLMKKDLVAPFPVATRRRGGPFDDFFGGMNIEEIFFAPIPGETKLVVVSTNPEGMVHVTEETEVELKPEAVDIEEKAIPTMTYEDIGGLGESINKIREMVELPMRHPELFTKLGIEPPKGVLLYGPPGSGKTLLARAVANESGVNFFSIAGPEIMSKWYGQSEENLRKIFEEAEKNAPSIIFIDEIDAIAPKREEVTGEVERRVVSQILTLMDGLKSRGKVIVIAATNRQNALDPALRRPGRFDREVEIGVPDQKGRKEILQIHTRNMPMDRSTVDLDYLASITYGFVGADLEALAKEAAMSALRRNLPQISWRTMEELPAKAIEKLKVTKLDFDNALKLVE
ncbi:MAG: AAA family ATPase, partial [Candidatus Aenigmarchaeota archaeon]|nr:AAA family ATPase [Candidatus Aenigmarchaeota archaeon]